jgi:hypothetical protein
VNVHVFPCTVKRSCAHTGLKRDGFGKMAACRVENGPLRPGESGQVLGKVSFGEGDKGVA